MKDKVPVCIQNSSSSWNMGYQSSCFRAHNGNQQDQEGIYPLWTLNWKAEELASSKMAQYPTGRSLQRDPEIDERWILNPKGLSTCVDIMVNREHLAGT